MNSSPVTPTGTGCPLRSRTYIRVLAIGRPMETGAVPCRYLLHARPDGRLRRPVEVPDLAAAIQQAVSQIAAEGLAPAEDGACPAGRSSPTPAASARWAGVACMTVAPLSSSNSRRRDGSAALLGGSDHDAGPNRQRQEQFEAGDVEGKSRHRHQDIVGAETWLAGPSRPESSRPRDVRPPRPWAGRSNRR